MIVPTRLPAREPGVGPAAGATRTARKHPSDHYAPNAAGAL